MAPVFSFLWHLIAAPPAALYSLLMRFRNHLYDIGSKPEIHFEIPIISIGNLTAGGTGKTPLTEYLINLLIDHKQVAVLSRGYGRQTRGFLLAESTATAATIGDEPMQYLVKFGSRITLAVSEDRVIAIPEILFANPDIEVILLDDAYQHRRVGRKLNLLLTSYERPFYSDYVMPRGWLREPRKGASRADAIVVTKCPPALTLQQKEKITAAIGQYAGVNKPVFFTTFHYAAPHSFHPEGKKLPEGSRVILVAGIAQRGLWEATMQSRFEVVEKYAFPDHYRYSEKDASRLVFACQRQEAALLCTEKDMVKLQPLLKKVNAGIQAFFQPIKVVFLEEEEHFKQLVFKAIEL
ncbi:MAG: tetraacyldisaccharide 4'-kinase [Cytophagales bacterium]|nr:tetraacyldisaccharide 4'-kinase [Bernardetiaceae bacterium]MDW8211397.1 tetraacyldisaccharide 4'-kinase [Cytophagales bacterium]